MTGLEAIPIVNGLIADLIKRAKDRETQALVQEIQSHQLVIQTELVEARAKIAKMDADHANAITAIREGHRLKTVEFDSQIEQLKTQLFEKQRDRLDEGCDKMLVAIAYTEEIHLQELIQWLGLQKLPAERMFDQLIKRGFIAHGLIGSPGKGYAFHTTAAGREYMDKANLLNAKPERPFTQRPPSRPAGFGRRRIY